MSRSPRIVIADDDAMLRFLTGRVVESFYPQAKILGASTGYEALCLLRQYTCDLLITDYQMPKLSGLDLMQLAHDEQLVPAILMIAGDASLGPLALVCGANAFLPKPISTDILAQTLAALLE